MNKVKIKDVVAAFTTMLTSGNFDHKPRPPAKNHLASEQMTIADLIKIVSYARNEDQYAVEPANFGDHSYDAHVLKVAGWYIKWCITQPGEMLIISVHPEEE